MAGAEKAVGPGGVRKEGWAVDGHLKCEYGNQVEPKRQHGGARKGAGRIRNTRTTGMAITIRLNFEEVYALHGLALDRNVGMRHLIVDLIREHFKLPAKQRNHLNGISTSQVGTWLRTNG